MREKFILILFLVLSVLTIGFNCDNNDVTNLSARLRYDVVLREFVESEFGVLTTQPCHPFDSCHKRCVMDSVAPKNYRNVTLSYHNCYCDQDCETFGDCCWDYENICEINPQPKPEPEKDPIPETYEEPESGPEEGTDSNTNPEQKATKSEEIGTLEEPKEILPSKDAINCVVVDSFSKGSYWMITKCAHAWPDDLISQKCNNVSPIDFASNLPVIGSTGWTYRNAFCAQCNYVKEYSYWQTEAQCVRSAPEKVLLGDAEMTSYYLQHFCTIKLKRGIQNTLDKNLIRPLTWRRSLRPCEQTLVDKCPDNYPNDLMTSLCHGYQSIVLVMEPNKANVAYKNTYCAMCNGVNIERIEASLYQQNTKEYPTEEPNINLSCPIWVLSKHYDNAYWELDSMEKSEEYLPDFGKDYKTSKWTPPSFSVIMRFNEDGTFEMTYHDDVTDPVNIPSQIHCDANELYDPFHATCRAVICAPGLVFTDEGCFPDPNITQIITTTPIINQADLPIAATVTVTLEIPLPPSNDSKTIEPGYVTDCVIGAFQHVINGSVENVTSESERVKSLNDEDEYADDVMRVTISFVIIESTTCTDDQMVAVVQSISNQVSYETLLMQSDSFSVLVVESKTPNSILVCRDGTEKTEYNRTEYSIVKMDDRRILYINSTDMYYLEDEYQLLDWHVTIRQNMTEYGFIEESRVAVCVEISVVATVSTPTPCNIYLPLNQSEYEVLENGSLLLIGRHMVIPPDQYISFGDDVAVCVDGYTPPAPATPQSTEEATDLMLIMSWVTFGLSLVSMLALLITFVTYCIFSELRFVAGCNLLNLTVALFAAMVTFFVGAGYTGSRATCTAVAILLHYLFLTTFFWNNVMAFDVWLTFGQGIRNSYRRSVMHRQTAFGRGSYVRSLVLKYALYAWGVPAILVGVCAALNFGLPSLRFGYTSDPNWNICWISNPTSNFVAFGGPLAVILIANAFFFVWSIVAIRKGSLKRRKESTISVTSPKVKKRKLNLKKQVKLETPNTILSDSESVFTFPETKETPKPISDLPPYKSRPYDVTVKPRRRHTSTTSVMSYSKSVGMARGNILLYVKMSTVMGFPWAIGFAAVLAETPVLWYIFELSVPMQGIFILIAFICKRRVFELYKNLLCGKPKVNKKELSKIKGKLTKSHKTVSENVSRPTPAVNITGISTPSTRAKERLRIYSTSSCDSEKWMTPARQLPDKFLGVVNEGYIADTSGQSRSNSESTYDDYL